MTYRERRKAKAERLRGWAEKRVETATATLEADHATYSGDVAFNTQPGHIPLRSRVIARGDRATESLRKAEDMARRAANIEAAADGAIYSDDPDACERLRERIAALEAERDRIKTYNASCRRGAPDESLLDAEQRATLASAQGWSPRADRQFPSYGLSNLSGNLKRQRDRLAILARELHCSVCELPFTVLSGGVAGCPVHGIRGSLESQS